MVSVWDESVHLHNTYFDLCFTGQLTVTSVECSGSQQLGPSLNPDVAHSLAWSPMCLVSGSLLWTVSIVEMGVFVLTRIDTYSSLDMFRYMGFLVENASAKIIILPSLWYSLSCHSTPSSCPASDQGPQLSEKKKDMLTCPPLWNSLAFLYFPPCWTI